MNVLFVACRDFSTKETILPKHMDVFLEDSGLDPHRCVLNRLGIARPLLANNPEEFVAEVSELSQQHVRYITIRRQQVRRLGEDLIREVLSDAGISVSSLGFVGGFTGALGMSYDKSLEDARIAFSMATEIGAQSLVVLPGHQGLHTYRHAERTVQEGLEFCRHLAVVSKVNLLVAANSVLGCQRDNFRPRMCPVLWTQQFCTPELRTLFVVRSGDRLPPGWREILAQGGCLRLCHKCHAYTEHTDLLARILSFLGRRSRQLA